MKKIFLAFLFLTLVLASEAQEVISGIIVDEQNQPLYGVNVYWLNTQKGTTSDQNGMFKLEYENTYSLVVSYVGYQTDTIDATNQKEAVKISLKPTVNLKEFEVTAHQASTNISTMTTLNVEQISSAELGKAACCNLSESFETNASVDIVESDALSGTKKVQMLGLDGVYSQILFENLPLIRGLSSSSGLTLIPGTWIESMQITKGTGTVVNGYESITGLINLEFQKPDKAEKLFVNIYGNNNSRLEANIHSARIINDRWSTMLFLHGNYTSMSMDRNGDTFLDMPKGKQLNVFNRWKYFGPKLMTQFGVRIVGDEKVSGQYTYDADQGHHYQSGYGVKITSNQFELYNKTCFRRPEHPGKEIAVMGTGRFHEQKALFGHREYNGIEKYIYLNSIFENYIGNTNHKIKTGLSFLYDNFNEQFEDSVFSREEMVPGAYAEYTFSGNEKFSAVAGVRGDYHNLFGVKVTPRVHLKYNFSEETAFRLSSGTGFRTTNVLVENASFIASSRELNVKEKLLPEEAVNLGLAFTQKFRILNRESYVNIDYYWTNFLNQVVIDLDASPRRIDVYNLDGKSFSNTVQVDFGVEVMPRLDVKLAYKYMDVKTTYSGALRNKPFVPQHRALFNPSYESANRKWKYSFTWNFFGKSRIPDTDLNPEKYQLKTKSDPYSLVLAQITRVIKKNFEVYLGAENLLNFTQPNPIISADDPFGKYFDAAMIWGPINGRVIYGGIRLSIK